MKKRKIKFPCMYNEHSREQRDFITVSESKKGIKFKLKDNLNDREVKITVPLTTAMEMRATISSAMIGSIEKRYEVGLDSCVWIRDAKVYGRPAVSILLAGEDDSESICVTTHQALELNDFIKDVYNNIPVM